MCCRTLFLLFCAVALAGGEFAAAPPAQSPPPIASLLDAYAAGEASRALAAVYAVKDAGRLRTAYQSEAATWAASGADRPRRTLIAAAFALEIVHAHLDREWQSVKGLIEWNCEQLREYPAPLPAERQWHLAVIALALRASDVRLLSPASKSGHIAHAAARFPSEARIPLAEGIALESQMVARRALNDSTPGRFAPLPTPSDGRRSAWSRYSPMVVRRYEELSKVAAVQAEARMRHGWLMLTEGQPNAALVALDAARAHGDDPFVRYLADLFRAWALEALDRSDEAEAAYRAALSTLPGAQSASLGLGSLLFQKGDADGAYTVVAASFAAQGAADDPWRIYLLGDYRNWSAIVERLRAEVRQ